MTEKSPQSNRFVGWLLLIVATILAITLLNHVFAANPVIALSTGVLDLGTGEQGETLSGALEIRNEGSAVLRITSIETGCACTAVSQSRISLEPGESTSIDVKLSLQPQAAVTHSSVKINSNALNSPESMIYVTGKVSTLSRASPSAIRFGEVPIGTTPSARVKIDMTGYGSSAGVTGNSEEGTTTIRRIVSDSSDSKEKPSSAEFNVTLKDRASLGAFTDTLFFHVSGSKQVIKVPVNGWIVPKYVVTPAALLISSHQPRRNLVIRRPDGHSIGRIEKVDAPPGVTVRQTSPPHPASSLLVFEVCTSGMPESAKPSDLSIRVRMDLDAEPLNIPILFLEQHRMDE